MHLSNATHANRSLCCDHVQRSFWPLKPKFRNVTVLIYTHYLNALAQATPYVSAEILAARTLQNANASCTVLTLQPKRQAIQPQGVKGVIDMYIISK